MKRRTYDTPAAFKRAPEDRLKAASTSGVDFARRRQLVVFRPIPGPDAGRLRRRGHAEGRALSSSSGSSGLARRGTSICVSRVRARTSSTDSVPPALSTSPRSSIPERASPRAQDPARQVHRLLASSVETADRSWPCYGPVGTCSGNPPGPLARYDTSCGYKTPGTPHRCF